jgi:hypothetical protein
MGVSCLRRSCQFTAGTSRQFDQFASAISLPNKVRSILKTMKMDELARTERCVQFEAVRKDIPHETDQRTRQFFTTL